MLPVIGLSLAAQIGPAGPRADTGKDAPAIASWETDDPANPTAKKSNKSAFIAAGSEWRMMCPHAVAP